MWSPPTSLSRAPPTTRPSPGWVRRTGRGSRGSSGQPAGMARPSPPCGHRPPKATCRPAPGAGRQLPPGPRSCHAGRTGPDLVEGDVYLPLAVERWHVTGASDRCREGYAPTAVARVRPTDSKAARTRLEEARGDRRRRPVRRRRRPRRLTRGRPPPPRTAGRPSPRRGAVGRLDLSPAVDPGSVAGGERACSSRAAGSSSPTGLSGRRWAMRSRHVVGSPSRSIRPWSRRLGVPSAPGSMRAQTGSSSR